MIVAFNGRRLLMSAAALLILGWFASRAVPPLAGFVTANLSDRRVPIYKVERDDMKVSISFDATWGTDQTDELLDILDRHGVKTTFFLAGYWVEKHPDYVKKIVERGHEVGNHSYEHPHMNALTKREIIADLERNHELLAALTETVPNLFRPPFGEYSDKVIEAAEELGYFTIQWSIDSLDWKDVSADFMVQRVLDRLEPGDIILFHNAGKHTPRAVDALLPRMRSLGYDVVPISELIHHDNFYVEGHSGLQRSLPGVESGDGQVE